MRLGVRTLGCCWTRSLRRAPAGCWRCRDGVGSACSSGSFDSDVCVMVVERGARHGQGVPVARPWSLVQAALRYSLMSLPQVYSSSSARSWRSFQLMVRSNSSRRTLRTHRSPKRVRSGSSGGVVIASHDPGVQFDEEQDVEPAEQHGVHGEEVGREHRFGLGTDELRPQRPRFTTRAAQDLPKGYRRRCDLVPELVKFSADAPVSPGRTLTVGPQDKVADLPGADEGELH